MQLNLKKIIRHIWSARLSLYTLQKSPQSDGPFQAIIINQNHERDSDLDLEVYDLVQRWSTWMH